MSYMNRSNDLTILVENQETGNEFEWRASVEYVDADHMAVPEFDVRVSTTPNSPEEEDMMDELNSFVTSKNIEKFLTEESISLIWFANKFGNMIFEFAE